MKRLTFLLIVFSLLLNPIGAQTPLAKKAAGAVFTLKTFDKDGQLLASSNGLFVSEQGEALSSYTPFKGAQRAVIIDAQGKEWPVECIIGVNDLYDVAKFKVDIKKAVALTVSSDQSSQGATVWLLPYSVKKAPKLEKGTVSSAETFQEKYAYYTLDMPYNELHVGCPVLNDNGQVVGILQPAADSKTTASYAVSAPFAQNMQMTGISLNDPALRATAIDKAVPDDLQQAMLAMLIGGSVMDSQQYNSFVDRFIRKFPQSADGYITRARQYAAAGRYADADQDMQQALKVADNKADAYYQYAQLIYQKVTQQPEPAYESWTQEQALKQMDQAVASFSQPYTQEAAPYLLARAQMLHEMGKYRLAVNDYNEYEKLMAGQVKAPFYYTRHQAEVSGHLYQQALNDISRAIELAPKKPLYYAEKASLELRVGMRDEAEKTAQECINVAPDLSDGYLFLGIAQCLKGNKTEGVKNMQKAQELGNDQAPALIEKYGK